MCELAYAGSDRLDRKPEMARMGENKLEGLKIAMLEWMEENQVSNPLERIIIVEGLAGIAGPYCFSEWVAMSNEITKLQKEIAKQEKPKRKKKNDK